MDSVPIPCDIFRSNNLTVECVYIDTKFWVSFQTKGILVTSVIIDKQDMERLSKCLLNSVSKIETLGAIKK